MSFGYDPAQVGRTQFEAAIADLGYGVEDAAAPAATPEMPATASIEVPDAVRDLFARAAKEGKLVVLKFTADWCAPCKGMTKVTLGNASVKAELATGFLLREIDTDLLPAVSKRYGVSGIPDTRIFRPDGTQIDQVRGFEGPADFLARLQRVREE